MTLLIDTGVVSPQDRVEFWANSSYDVYHPLQIRTGDSVRFQARMWGEHDEPHSRRDCRR
jgi:hypothetical protein